MVRSPQRELLERRRQVKPSNRSSAPPKSPDPSRSQSHCAHIQIRAHREDNSVRKIDAFCPCMKKDTHTCSTLLSALLCIKPNALSPFLRRLMLHKQPGYASHHITSHHIASLATTNKTQTKHTLSAHPIVHMMFRYRTTLAHHRPQQGRVIYFRPYTPVIVATFFFSFFFVGGGVESG